MFYDPRLSNHCVFCVFSCVCVNRNVCLTWETMMKNHKLPIFSPMNGRDVIGFASGIRSATAIIRGLITVDPRCTLHVWQRSKCFIDMTDVLEMPDGFCYAISYKY